MSAPINRPGTVSSQKANGYIPMRVKDALTNQHRTVLSLTAEHTVGDAIEKMTAAGANAPLVTSGHRPTGIFTRSDVMRASVDSPEKSFSAIPLGETVSADLVSLTPEDDTASAIEVMLRAGVEYLPVLKDKQPIAILSIHNLMACHIDALNNEIEQLNDYINQLHDSFHD